MDVVPPPRVREENEKELEVSENARKPLNKEIKSNDKEIDDLKKENLNVAENLVKVKISDGSRWQIACLRRTATCGCHKFVLTFFWARKN
jgi:hypothetical protein